MPIYKQIQLRNLKKRQAKKKIKLKNNEIKHGIVLQQDAFKIDTKPRQIYNFLLQL